MRNILHVIKHEISCTIGKPIFWITTIIFPVVIMAFSIGAQFISVKAFTEEPDILGNGDQSEQIHAIGYVDHADIIHSLPSGLPANLILAYPDKTAAQQAMDSGKLSHYYIIEQDYLETGDLLVIEKEFSPLGDLPTVDLFQSLIINNLTGDNALGNLIDHPIQELESYAIDREETETVEQDNETIRFVVSFGVLFILFMVLTMSSSFMLRSVSQEKENRTVEVLLVSIKPNDLIMGKIIGLGLVALLQMAIWFGGSSIIMQQNNPILRSLGIFLTQDTILPKGFIYWGVIFMLLGYTLYASILGAIGALAPNSRETGQFTFIALVPLMIPMWMNTVFIQAPNGELATLLSLIPLTAPTSMLTRLANGGVPIWQPIVSVFGLAITTYIFVRLAARFFRADTLLSSASLDWQRLGRELFHKQG